MQTRNQLNFMPRSPRSLLLDLLYSFVCDTIPHVLRIEPSFRPCFFSFSPPLPRFRFEAQLAIDVQIRVYRERDELSVRVISKLVNDVIVRDQRNSKNCVFVCLTLLRLITTIFTTESMHRIWEYFSLTKVNIASCRTICA